MPHAHGAPLTFLGAFFSYCKYRDSTTLPPVGQNWVWYPTRAQRAAAAPLLKALGFRDPATLGYDTQP